MDRLLRMHGEVVEQSSIKRRRVWGREKRFHFGSQLFNSSTPIHHDIIGSGVHCSDPHLLATSLRYPTNATKFSNPPSARLLNSGDFFLSIFLIWIGSISVSIDATRVNHDNGLTTARIPGIALSNRAKNAAARNTG